MTRAARHPACFAVFATLLIPSAAVACTCADNYVQPGQSGLNSEEGRKKNRLDKALIVAKGRMLSATVGREIVWPAGAGFGDNIGSSVGTSARPVSAQFEIAEVIKGSVGGRVTLWSGPGRGECGIGGVLLGAAIQDVDVSLELIPVKGSPDNYTVDMCGYMDAERPKSPSAKPQ